MKKNGHKSHVSTWKRSCKVKNFHRILEDSEKKLQKYVTEKTCPYVETDILQGYEL